MQTTDYDELQEQDEQQDTVAIRQCLVYLLMESERLGLSETARFIAIAVDSMEEKLAEVNSAQPEPTLHS